MISVYKYEVNLRELDRDSTAWVPMPRTAHLLHVACQHDDEPDLIAIWARVDTSDRLVDRRICVFGTGHEIPEWLAGARHVGTCVTFGGRLVWHVFDGGER